MNFNIFDHELIFITEWFVFHTFRISLVEMWNTAMTLMFTNARSYCRRKIVKMFISILSSYSFRHLAFSCLLWDLHSTLKKFITRHLQYSIHTSQKASIWSFLKNQIIVFLLFLFLVLTNTNRKEPSMRIPMMWLAQANKFLEFEFLVVWYESHPPYHNWLSLILILIFIRIKVIVLCVCGCVFVYLNDSSQWIQISV